jgi:hypothetical protein
MLAILETGVHLEVLVERGLADVDRPAESEGPAGLLRYRPA